jgi:predicted nucleotidyltransferase
VATNLLVRNPAAAHVLGLLSALAGAEIHTREIARRTRHDVHSAQLALTHLLNEGFVASRRLGNLRLWSIDLNNPDARRLGAALRFATRPLEELASGLASVQQVRVALVFGSFASATDRPDSDIDIFAVGSVNWSTVAELGQTLERDLGRPTNFVIWTEEEFRRPSTAQVAFLADILSRPRSFLVGGDGELERAREAVAVALAGSHPPAGAGSDSGEGATRDRPTSSGRSRAAPTAGIPRRRPSPGGGSARKRS